MNQQKRDEPLTGNTARANAGLERIIEDLSRLRERIDLLDLPASKVQHELGNHLTLASVAALRLRFMPDDDKPLADD